MATRAVDKNGDWIFGNGLVDYKTEQEEIKQNIITTLKSWKGDCFFDMDAGVDWYNFLGGYNREKELKTQIISELYKVSGVVQIRNVDFFYNEKRKIVISLKITTIYGNLELESEYV